MPAKDVITIQDHLEKLTSDARPIVEAALETVRSVAGDAEEVVYRTSPPCSPSFMWKLVHYRIGGDYVVGIGTFPKHSALFVYRGTELADRAGLLQGGGKAMRYVALRTPGDARAPEVRQLVSDAFELARRTAPFPDVEAARVSRQK